MSVFLRVVFSLIFLLTTIPAVGQISQGGTPKSLQTSFSASAKSSINSVATDPIDVDQLLAEDARDEKTGEIPFRFGYPFEVDYNLDNSGSWEMLPDGGTLWRLKISAPGAFSINLIYDEFLLPEGATLYVYNEAGDMVIGAFTAENNKEHGMFSTQPVKGDVTIVEYFEPAEVSGQGRLSISTIIHAYRDIFNYGGTKDADGFGSSGSCNNNVNCSVGDPWQDETRGVAMAILSSGSRWCTGSMINNVREDGTQYFLTANHCLGSESTWILMFNYQSPGCTNVNGPTYMTVQGTIKRASYATSDFGLLEIQETIPDSYNIYYNGWSNIDVVSTNSIGIHHPAGDIKKISFDDNPSSSANYLQTTGSTHWRVGNWEDGTTEGGSSGSPLFDQNHRITGQLHGGYASCASITADWYGKVSMSWNGGGSSSNRLKDWLDPDNTGATTLDGYDPFAGVQIAHTPLSDTNDTLNNYTVVANITSIGNLIPSEMKLNYDIGGGYVEQVLSNTATDEYTGYIPAQSGGTTVNYFISAEDDQANADTTDIFSFYVDFTPLINIDPVLLDETVTQLDSTTTDLIVGNDGSGTLDYDIAIIPNLKSASVFWDLYDQGEVEAPHKNYASDFYNLNEPKGADKLLTGVPVTKDAGGPDGFGYFWIDSDEPGGPVFNWIDITGSGIDITAGIADDNYVGPFPIGFSFPFYGNAQTEFYVGSNGIIGFDTANMKARQKTPLPSSGTPNNILAWLWDDLDISNPNNTSGAVYYQSDGTQLIIQFVDFPEYSAQVGDIVNAEVIIDSDGTIIYQYLTIAPGFDEQNCTVGIENDDGSDGLETAYLTAYLHDDLAIQYYMPYPWLLLSQTSGSVPAGEADTIECKFITGDLDPGIYSSNLIIASNDPTPGASPTMLLAQLTVIEGQTYICGDANGDEDPNVGDAVYLINFVFKDGPAPDPLEAGNVNCDEDTNVGDAVYMINFVFNSGPPPCDGCK